MTNQSYLSIARRPIVSELATGGADPLGTKRMYGGAASRFQNAMPRRGVANPCYDLRMITALKTMLARIERWPSEDQEVLEAARSTEAERAGASEAELAAIDRGLDDARAGRFGSDDAAAKVRGE